MSNFSDIQNKLEQFIAKYYANELIKGAILFLSIGLLYFLVTLLVENFLWLDSIGRTILFWLVIAVELLLFMKFIVIPVSRLLKLQKGIDYKHASKLIGNHFPEVNDKLLNVLQLNENESESELLMASIEQKSSELTPVPFKLAINFKRNVKYLNYAVIPVIILMLAFVTGKFNWFSDSYERVVNYQTAYEPPAPFEFYVLNESLQALENKKFKLIVKAAGEVVPESAKITFNEETYYLQQKGMGEFEYIFEQPRNNIQFNLTANEVKSKPYTLTVLKVPTLVNFRMVLDYPKYTKKRDEVLKSTGNAIVPQGTNVTWELKTKSTDNVFMYANDTLKFNSKNDDEFVLSKQLYSQLNYTISTNNKNLKDYENLDFNIAVIKDEFPDMNLKSEIDSLDQQTLYFYGQVSDDYGLSKLQLVYYPIDNKADFKKEPIPINRSNFDEFVNTFPGNLDLTDGTSYELYFEIFDNDANRNKSTKSAVFSYRKLTRQEEENRRLNKHNATIKDMGKSLKKFKEQERELQELSKTQKEKSELNFNDQKKLENFLKRQKQQKEMMQNFNKKLKDNLEEFQKDNQEEDQFNEDLKERLEENQEQLKKDEKLLEELQKLADKINKEEFTQKLEELAKQNKNQKRSMQQLLELTKRFYVAKKMEKLANELEKLAEEQEKLSEETPENNTKEEQEELNEKFEDFQKEMEELKKDNEDLKKPMDIPQDKLSEEEIKKEQKEATEQLEKKEQSQDEKEKHKNQEGAKQKQKKAAQKMKQMSAQMMSSMQMGGGQQDSEDSEMLRQILDNLVLFSFDQEALMDRFKTIEVNHNEYAYYLRNQQNLREHFQHIDDSLFALSLRQPKISEKINKEITEVFFNIDKSLTQLSENQLYQGASTQQYTITAANNLASMLSDSLDNMQMNMSGQGQGEGEEGLPDIIMSQEELNKQMQEGMKKSKDGKPNEGEEGKEGEKGNEGEKDGKKKGKGKKGEGGEQQGEGEGTNEELNGELFRIYQQQAKLREALQDKLGKHGESGQGKNLLKKMEEIELDLINKGFTNQTLQKMMQLQHQLLKLENATFQQGEDKKRKSETNKQQFNNSTNNKIPAIKKYFNTTEILNRQALPLQPVYKKKVQEYFKQVND
ncbi:MAG: hypothetical protein HKO81_09160 [Flavobacteriaceae bacterium]|nr:hypothetical protein [Flavobacteriaceae bacterium]